MRFAVLLALAACSTSGPSGSPPFQLDLDYDSVVASADVSILYPITAATDRDQLIAPTEAGRYGQLLAADITPAPFGSAGDGGGLGYYDDLRLVSLRLDPCSARGGCSPEVRLIYQPVLLDTDVVDGAVHVFYALPADELRLMLEQILTLKKAHGAGVAYPDALGPHPVLAATGLEGPFAEGLRAVLLDHLGTDRVVRVTMMQHAFLDGHIWVFAQLDRGAAGLVAHTIIDLGAQRQEIQGAGATDPLFLGGIYPSAQATPSVPELEALASEFRPEQPTPELEVAFGKAIEVQHPDLHSSEDTDCGSCHIAEGARRAGEAYGFTPMGEFTSARSLAYVRDSLPLTNFHAFGYLGTAVSIMQRTANERAVVSDRMQEDLAP